MDKHNEELTPIEYGPAIMKTASYGARKGDRCFYLHWHDRMELIRLQEGVLKIGYGTDTKLLHAGEIYIIPPRLPHHALCESEAAQWDVLMFDVQAYYNGTPLCRNMLQPLQEGRVKFALSTDQAQTVECFDRIFALAGENDFGVIGLVYQFLDLLFKNTLVEISNDVKGRHVMQQATEYIKNNLPEKISTKQLSQEFGYTEEHFCRLFKEMTGFTPMNYLRICRLEKALNLLRNENLSVSEVAARCGFDDSNYFARCFKTHFGKTPREFIRKD